MTLGFVFTNYNNTHFTEQLLESLMRIVGIEDCRIVIVDNNSDESNRGKLVLVGSKWPCVSVILNDENVGYFNGLNDGIRFLRRENPTIDYIVVGNNDLVFEGKFVDSVASNRTIFSKYPVVAPDIVTASGTHQNPHVIKKTGWFRECMYDLYYANYYVSRAIIALTNRVPITKRKDDTHYQSPMEIHQGYGACYLLGPLFFEHFEELWAPTFLMGEEYFLAAQLEEKGFPIFYEPSIRVFHCEHATTRKIPRREMWDIASESHKIYRKYKARI